MIIKSWAKDDYRKICKELFVLPTDSLLNNIQMFVELGQQHHQKIDKDYIIYIIEDLCPTRVVSFGDESFYDEIQRLTGKRKAVLIPINESQTTVFVQGAKYTFDTYFESEIYTNLYYSSSYKDKFFNEEKYESINSALELFSEFDVYPDVPYFGVSSCLTNKGYTLDTDLEHSKIEILKGEEYFGVGLIVPI